MTSQPGCVQALLNSYCSSSAFDLLLGILLLLFSCYCCMLLSLHIAYANRIIYKNLSILGNKSPEVTPECVPVSLNLKTLGHDAVLNYVLRETLTPSSFFSTKALKIVGM